jgi:ERCC4-type nuclease
MKEPRRRRVKVAPADNPLECPFVVIVDSREQAPFAFTGLEGEGRDAGRPLIVETRVAALESGDYSIAGLESRVAVERKSVSDYFGSIGGGRERFEREMERLSHFDFAAVVIEGDWRELLIDRPSNVQIPGKVASRTIVSWSIRWGVHHFPTMGRRHAELLTFQILAMYWRQLERRQEAVIEAAAQIFIEQ